MAIALAFILVIMSAVTFMMGVNVLIYDDINQKHNQHYVILCGASSIWSFCHAGIGLSPNEEVGTFFRSVAFIGILVVVAKGILLASYWTEMPEGFQKGLRIYVIIASLLIYPLIIERGSVNFVETPYGYFFTFKRYPGRMAFMLYVFTIFVFGSIIVYHGFHVSKRKRQQKMAWSTLICMGVFAIGMIFDIIIPLFGIASFPASTIAQFFSVLLVYMVSLRYNVSRMTIANISEYIYSFGKTPIVILDEKGKIQLANNAAGEFLAIPIDQIIGKDPHNFFKMKQEALQDGGIKSIFGECLVNGAKCDLAVTEILDHYDESLGKLVIVTDMTDKIDLIHKLEESRKEAIQANEAKSAFLANMSHEIRTPMNTIIGISELLLRRELKEEIKQELCLIRNAGTGLLSVINDILDISKVESGKFEIMEAPYMLSSLLVDVVNMMAVRLVDKGIYFLVKVDGTLPAGLVGDNLRIKQVLINIIGNAIKFTSKGYILLEVSGHHTGEDEVTLVIRVEDSGIGIRKEDMGKLFGVFNQVDTRRNRNITGTGLGLAISQKMIQLMGGEIGVESEYGKGTTFTMKIQQKIKQKTPVADIHDKKKIKILIYEQDEIMVWYFNSTLQKMGLSYVICSTKEKLFEEKNYTYLLIRSVYYEKNKSVLEQEVEKEKIVLLLNMGEELTKARKELHHISLPLFCFQMTNLLNNDHVVYVNGRKEYDLGQIKPLPFASVLVVDDNETNLHVAKGMMSTYQMEIDTVGSGYDALIQVTKKKYDMIFMDHMMPGLDGIDTTKKIREMEDEYYKTVPIVALTANAMSGAREEFIREGFDDFLAKPMEYKELDRILCKFVLPHAPAEYKQMLQKLDDAEKSRSSEKDYNLQLLDGRLEGIHMKERVQEFGGSVSLYLNILQTYYEDIRKRKEELIALYKEQNLEAFTISVHALKSASYNVGADKLGKMAELLEHAGKERNSNWIGNSIEELMGEIDQTIQAVGDLLEYAGKEKEEEKQEEMAQEQLTEEYLETLLEYCVEMEFEDLEREVSYLRNSSFIEGQQELTERLVAAFDEFEYEQFAKILKEYLRQKGEQDV